MGAPFSWWGRWFPRGHRFSWWRRWFPEPDPPDTVPGSTAAGAGTFVLEENVKLSLSWVSGLFKSYSGKERRTSTLDDPAQRYEGDAVLAGAATRKTRVRLAKYAALGKTFQIGLPWEELPIAADADGTRVYVDTTALSDWAVPGMRVVVRRAVETYPFLVWASVDAVIQAVWPNAIDLDVAPGEAGDLGGSIMPAVSVYLDAQQGFPRYRTPEAVERWQIKARNADAGIAGTPVPAILDLDDPVTHSGYLGGLRLQARDGGAGGNDIVVTETDDALTSGCEIIEDVGAKTLHIKYLGDTSTVAEYIAAVNNGSALVRVVGIPADPAAVLVSVEDEFPPTNLSGGADHAEVGRGATVTEFAGRPVWDRYLTNEDTALDTMQSSAEAEDLGALPFVVAEVAVPDWGRGITLEAELGIEWQWSKRFFDTIRARWRTFWLATWRPDLIATASGVGTLTVHAGEEAGDVFTWWPAQRTCLQIWQADDTKTYVRITSAVDNGNGTATLTIVDEDDNPVAISGSPIQMLSWLEQVRLEDDQVEVDFSDAEFELHLDARVVQDLADLDGPAIGAQPRTGLRMRTPAAEYRIATGSRDIVIDGATYTATPAAHDAIETAIASEDAAAIITMPVTHAVPQRWLAGGVPPRSLTVDIFNQQLGGTEFEILWQGVVTSIAVEGHLAKLRVSSRMSASLERRLPVLTVGRSCPHILYDVNCTVDREAATTDSTIVSINGRKVTFSGTAGDDQFLRRGPFTHVPSGEEMTIIDHVGSVVTLQLPIWGMRPGDAIRLAPGCDNEVVTCDVKYSNRENYGGEAQLPTKNPFLPTGIGVVEQA